MNEEYTGNLAWMNAIGVLKVTDDQKVMTRSEVEARFPDLAEIPEVIVTDEGEFLVVDDPEEG